MDLLESLKSDMSTEFTGEKLEELRKETKLETEFYAANADCQAAGRPLAEMDLRSGELIHPDSSVPGLLEILGRPVGGGEKVGEPFCAGYYGDQEIKKGDNEVIEQLVVRKVLI